MKEVTLPSNDRKAWHAHWKAQGQPWRTEPLIAPARQQELTECLQVVSDIEQGIYPFANMALSRADIEWLLTQHENGQGPVIWDDEREKNPSRRRDGLDLRGCDVSRQDLSMLPLARTLFSLRWDEWKSASLEQRQMALANLEHASLWGTNLEGIRARGVSFKGANLGHAYLEKAQLLFSNLTGADLHGARFFETELEGARLCDPHGEGPLLLDTIWEKTDLSVLNWNTVSQLGDESRAQQKAREGASKNEQIEAYQKAERAYRQQADYLKKQSLEGEAARFLYRSKIVERKLLWKQRRMGAWFVSLLQALVAGYGYRPSRLLLTLLLHVGLFSALYYGLAVGHTPLTVFEAINNSIMTLFGSPMSEPNLPHTELIRRVSQLQTLSGTILWGLWGLTGLQWLLGK